MVKLTIEIPDGIREALERGGGNLAESAREAAAIMWYQKGRLSVGQVAELLETSVNEAQGILKRYGVEEITSFQEYEQDRKTLERLL